MSIYELRQKGGKDEKGKLILHDPTMRYEDGGKIQVFKSGDNEIRFGPAATDDEIIAAFKELI